MYPLIVKLDI